MFLLTYFTRPMHFFGKLGLASFTVGSVILGYLASLKIMGQHIMMEHGPLMMAGALLFMTGVMMFSTGLLGEMLMRTYFESQGRRIYAVREILSRKQGKAKAEGAR